MTEAKNKPEAPAAVIWPVAPGPHIGRARSTRAVMIDVVIALIPAMAVGIYVFGWRAAMLIGVSVASCVFFEALWQQLRGRRQTIMDFSAVVTGIILALSIPWTLPWYGAVVGAGMAILITKMCFGGLGSNVFNPAMGGRAFLQACFAAPMTTYVLKQGGIETLPAHAARVVDAATGATPLAVKATSALDLLLGTVNGSIGETSAIACVLGGLYLIVRRAASWRIPLAMLISAAAVGELNCLLRPQTALPIQNQLLSGALLFGAAFIVTDPATSPLSRRGRWIYGAGVGALVMLIRLFAAVPEGVMYAVLVMNITVPLIDRYTVPRPVGGPTPSPKPT
ncbi:MAG TPA: RnfABCDGE type electron transport complex subunit D [Phycisphaerae bacterium]|nr:RnfABCDGE type electron transport complex subunit D [Phycisphaerae bacterium]